MRWKYRYMITSFAGSYVPDDVDTFLLNLKKTVKRIENILRDKTKCEFIPVCIPESMAISETNRLLSDLNSTGIVAQQIIVNNVMVSDDCAFCRNRKAGQSKYLEQINDNFQSLNRVEVPVFETEIRGLESLNRLKRGLFGSQQFN